jgi:hypothetical protein
MRGAGKLAMEDKNEDDALRGDTSRGAPTALNVSLFSDDDY